MLITKLRLYHWSPEPMILDRQRQYEQQKLLIKPRGFWFDVDEDWRHWCEAYQWRTTRLAYRHPVTLIKPERILWLNTVKSVTTFTKEFLLQRPEIPTNIITNLTLCDWIRVTKKYAGVIISPYRWVHRMKFVWYHDWGCACGCVWDLSAIELGEAEHVEISPSFTSDVQS